jgi:pilus assembly protein CpaB
LSARGEGADVRKQIVVVAAAAVLAVVGIAALVRYANNADDRAFEGTEMVEVLRATQNIAARTPVSQLGDVTETVKVPRAALVPGALESLKDQKDKVTSVALVAGDQLSSAKFASESSLPAELALPKGKQELTIPVGGARLVGGAVSAGDRVGVMASFSGVTANPINNLLVLKVDGGVGGADDAGTLVTFAVTKREAQQLVYTMEFGKLWLTKQNSKTDVSGKPAISMKDVTS